MRRKGVCLYMLSTDAVIFPRYFPFCAWLDLQVQTPWIRTAKGTGASVQCHHDLAQPPEGRGRRRAQSRHLGASMGRGPTWDFLLGELTARWAGGCLLLATVLGGGG